MVHVFSLVLCLEAFFEQVKGVDMQYPHESPPRQTAVFDQSVTYLETQKTEWEGSIGFPADYHWFTCSETTKAEIREEILESKELDINSHWLVHKEKVCVLYIFYNVADCFYYIFYSHHRIVISIQILVTLVYYTV